LGIPAYVYALTTFPNHAVHQFNGKVAFPQALSISEGEWADDALAEAATKRVVEQIQAIDQPWLGLFVGHPTKFRYADWWDTPYYQGRTPVNPEFALPLPIENYNRAKQNLRSFLEELKVTANIVGLDEALEMPWRFRPPSEAELAYYHEHTETALLGAKNWPIHSPDLDASNIVRKTFALSHTVHLGELTPHY
jgi:hypothetical protein